MDGETIRFPEGSVECRPGDHLVRRDGDRFRVVRVQELVLLSRLLPTPAPGPVRLIEEHDLRDSEPPWRMNEVHLLVAAYPRTFRDEAGAVAAVEAGAELGEPLDGLCLRASQVPSATTRVVPRASLRHRNPQ